MQQAEVPAAGSMAKQAQLLAIPTVNDLHQQACHAQVQLLDELEHRDLPAFWSSLSALHSTSHTLCSPRDGLASPRSPAAAASPQSRMGSTQGAAGGLVDQEAVMQACTNLRNTLQGLWDKVHSQQLQLQRLCADLMAQARSRPAAQHSLQQPPGTTPVLQASLQRAPLEQHPQPGGAAGAPLWPHMSAASHASEDAAFTQHLSFALPQPAGGAAGADPFLDGSGGATTPTAGGPSDQSFSFPSLQQPSSSQQAAAAGAPSLSFMAGVALQPEHHVHLATPFHTLGPASTASPSTGPTTGGLGAYSPYGVMPSLAAQYLSGLADVALPLCGVLERYASAVTARIVDTATCSLTDLLQQLFDACTQAMMQQQQTGDEGLATEAPAGYGSRPMSTSPEGSVDMITSSDAKEAAAIPAAAALQIRSKQRRPLQPLHLAAREGIDQRGNGMGSMDGVTAPEQPVRPSVTPSTGGRTPPLALSSAPHPLQDVAVLLRLLGLWPAVQEAAARSLATAVRAHCTQAANSIDTAALPGAWQFMEEVPLRFLRLITPGAARAGSDAWGDASMLEDTLQAWRHRLVYLVYEAVCGVRLAQLWDMLVEYPDSLPAVEDLAACLAHTNSQQHLVKCFRSVLSRRLLHAGASAQVVVHTYVTLIRVLQALDPPAAVLRAVVGPVRLYLRSRPDTVRCVVERVTGGTTGTAAAPGGDSSSMMDTGTQAATSLLEELQQEELEQQEQRVGGGLGTTRISTSGASRGARPPPSWTEDDVLSLIQQQDCAAAQAGPAPTPQHAKHVAASMYRLSLDGSMGAAGGVGRGAVLGEVPGSAVFGPLQARPPGAAGARPGGASSIASVVQLLVRVFKSKEHFMTEYRAVLARGLLQAMDYDTTQALRTIELLKLRFGEARLHAAEVMLKDVADSKRINSACHALTAGPQPPGPPPSWLSATITSHLFWPRLGGWGDDAKEEGGRGGGSVWAVAEPAEASLVLPSAVQQGLATYAAAFQSQKAPRKLHWRPHVGQVHLEVNVGGVAIDFHVSPLLATLLLAFESQDQLSVDDIADQVGLPVALVRRRLLFWVEQGILVEAPPLNAAAGWGSPARPGMASPGAHAAAAAAAAGAAPGGLQLQYQKARWLDPARHGSCVSDADAQDEPMLVGGGLLDSDKSLLQEMSVYEPYLMGILLNTGGLPLDRLHNMLKRFVVSPKYDKSLEQLAGFLSLLVAASKVVVQGGVYKRKPAAAKPADNP